MYAPTHWKLIGHKMIPPAPGLSSGGILPPSIVRLIAFSYPQGKPR